MLKRWPLLMITMLLGACGGGGGGDGGSAASGQSLVVGLDYVASIPLLTSTVVPARALGFEGRTPSCVFVSGDLPPGMQLRSDCALAGRATQAGRFGFVVRVSAPGVVNSLDIFTSARVPGPSVNYTNRSFLQAVTPGTSINDLPAFVNWTAPPDIAVTWNFAVTFGSLPPGLTLDPSTGLISGTAQGSGSYSATIRPTIHSPFGPIDFTTPYSVTVNQPRFGYPLPPNETQNIAYLARPFSLAPFLSGGDVLTNARLVSGTLPPGLGVDAATGEITGIPLGSGAIGEQMYELEAQLTHNGVTATAFGLVNLGVRDPVAVQYPSSNITLDPGFPVVLAPIVTRVVPPSGPFSYSVAAGVGSCNLPPGLGIDGLGVISGTPTAAGSHSCSLILNLADSGVSWTRGAAITITVR